MSFKKIKVTNFNDLQKIGAAFNNPGERWLYRGHSNSEWPLLSKFERYFDNYNTRLSVGSVGKVESKILREFRALKPKYYSRIPTDSDRLAEIIFLQHNGCATRLLDISSNFYIACFFALHDIGLAPTNLSCCIWCFNQQKIIDSLQHSGYETLYHDLEDFDLKQYEADIFIETDFKAKDGVLLIGNQVDTDHQKEQSGRFFLALNTEKPMSTQLFGIYGITTEDILNSSSEPFNDDDFKSSVLPNHDVFQIIIEKMYSVDCERCLIINPGLNLRTLFKNGINSELADLNSHFFIKR